MAMWLQKIVLTVVAIVPVIVGEIVRVTDTGDAEETLMVAPRPATGRQGPGFPSLVPSPSPPSTFDVARDPTVRRC